MPAPRKRFTLDLEPDMQRRLKIAAALKGMSMRQYCVEAIGRGLDSDLPSINESRPFTEESLRAINESRDRIFGGSVTSNSVELVHQARQERQEQLERTLRGD